MSFTFRNLVSQPFAASTVHRLSANGPVRVERQHTTGRTAAHQKCMKPPGRTVYCEAAGNGYRLLLSTFDPAGNRTRTCTIPVVDIRRGRFILLLGLASALCVNPVASEPVAVRHAEGIVHGFLALRTLDGATLADGDLLQTARGATVTSRLVFRFKDGSIHDETAVFSQRGHFRLLTDHLVQKGPAFPRALDMRIDATTSEVTVRYSEGGGKEKTETEHVQLEPDVANGLVLTLLKNVQPDAPPKSLTYIAATPKPQVVKIDVAIVGHERFRTAGAMRTAAHYVLKVDIGGVKGLIAPLVGKQPPDSHVWVLDSDVPAFVKSEQALYLGGPVWRIELVSPDWPQMPKT